MYRFKKSIFFYKIINLFKIGKSDNSRLNNTNDFDAGVVEISFFFFLVFAL